MFDTDKTNISRTTGNIRHPDATINESHNMRVLLESRRELAGDYNRSLEVLYVVEHNT